MRASCAAAVLGLKSVRVRGAAGDEKETSLRMTYDSGGRRRHARLLCSVQRRGSSHHNQRRTEEKKNKGMRVKTMNDDEVKVKQALKQKKKM